MSKFKVGEAVEMVTHSPKLRKERIWKLKVLEVTESSGAFFYRVDKRNWLSESMLRTPAKEAARG